MLIRIRKKIGIDKGKQNEYEIRNETGPEHKMWIKRSNVVLVKKNEKEQEKKKQAKYASKQANQCLRRGSSKSM